MTSRYFSVLFIIAFFLFQAMPSSIQASVHEYSGSYDVNSDSDDESETALDVRSQTSAESNDENLQELIAAEQNSVYQPIDWKGFDASQIACLAAHSTVHVKGDGAVFWSWAGLSGGLVGGGGVVACAGLAGAAALTAVFVPWAVGPAVGVGAYYGHKHHIQKHRFERLQGISFDPQQKVDKILDLYLRKVKGECALSLEEVYESYFKEAMKPVSESLLCFPNGSLKAWEKSMGFSIQGPSVVSDEGAVSEKLFAKALFYDQMTAHFEQFKSLVKEQRDAEKSLFWKKNSAKRQLRALKAEAAILRLSRQLQQSYELQSSDSKIILEKMGVILASKFDDMRELVKGWADTEGVRLAAAHKEHFQKVVATYPKMTVSRKVSNWQRRRAQEKLEKKQEHIEQKEKVKAELQQSKQALQAAALTH